jgi:hypothetical protein
MDTSKITNILIFKDGYYYLTIQTYFAPDKFTQDSYHICPEDWEINNGFKFASDAYAYLNQLRNTSTGALATVGVGGRKI